MLQLQEINQRGRYASISSGVLNADPFVTLQEFKEMICEDFVGPGPYPTYILPLRS
ncbi:hypothetical protein L210DRAFT_3572572 [Boletus edulis BED1]|uniref:Uncharacterized protein n=1 Tax=Boletus edulis BED1 TaxID=1328754 RepID=A0AAD4BD16_BOLED|nr:hypothetical protein L210DRAFT_3572572 [Boletus edulis BED1]